jgi:hypothetical protein
MSEHGLTKFKRLRTQLHEIMRNCTDKICRIHMFHGKISSDRVATPHISEDGRSRIEDVLATSLVARNVWLAMENDTRMPGY